jgi:hypothetical protein
MILRIFLGIYDKLQTKKIIPYANGQYTKVKYYHTVENMT